MAGLFGTFTTALRGLNVQQGALNTTSHNIANVNTEGYSRQRVVVETTRPQGGMSRFDTSGAGQVGTGAEITAIQRVRNLFVDYQIRSETGTSGYYTTASQTLSQVEDIFGEPSDTGIESLMTKFYQAFEKVSKPPITADVQKAAVEQASALADEINYAYNQLEKTSQNCQEVLQQDVTDVNSYLDQINELNKQIKGVSAVGQTPNDLMDSRDLLIDKLSYKFGIKLDKEKYETINLSSTEYPNNNLVKSNPNDTDYNRFSYVESATTSGNSTDGYKVKVQYYPLGDEKAELKSFEISVNSAAEGKELSENLTQNRILIGNKDGLVGTETITTGAAVTETTAGTTIAADGTITTITIEGTTKSKTVINPPATALAMNGKVFKTYKYDTDSTSGTALNNVDNNNVKGEIAAIQSVQVNIKSMMESLDRLAEGLAYSVNAIQTGSIDPSTSLTDVPNNLIFVTYDEVTKTNTTKDDGITAKNIRISSDLINDPTKLNCNVTVNSGVGDGKRAAAIANLSTLKMKISNISSSEDLTQMTRDKFLKAVGIDATTPFTDAQCLSLNAGTDGSTADSYYKTIINNLAVQEQEATRKADNQETILANLVDQRSQESGVSLDEETTNLIQFQHAYQANAKMISTIDELLDVVINGLKK